MQERMFDAVSIWNGVGDHEKIWNGKYRIVNAGGVDKLKVYVSDDDLSGGVGYPGDTLLVTSDDKDYQGTITTSRTVDRNNYPRLLLVKDYDEV